MPRAGLLLTAGALLALAACDRADRENAQDAPAPQAAPAVVKPPAGAQPSAEARLTPYGYGPVRVGMSEAEARAALGPAARADEGSGEPESCHFLYLGAQPDGVAYMVQGGRVTRVTVEGDRSILTDRGLGLGATELEIRAAYGPDVEVEPHKYLGEGAKYLTVWTLPEKRGLRYATDEQGVVREIHAGDSSIRFVEGCS